MKTTPILSIAKPEVNMVAALLQKKIEYNISIRYFREGGGGTGLFGMRTNRILSSNKFTAKQ
jgi:hypothetical protein